MPVQNFQQSNTLKAGDVTSQINFVTKEATKSIVAGIEFISSLTNTTLLMSLYVGYFIGLMVINLCIAFWRPQSQLYPIGATTKLFKSPLQESLKTFYSNLRSLFGLLIQILVFVPFFYRFGKFLATGNFKPYYLYSIVTLSLSALFLSWFFKLFMKYSLASDALYEDCAKTELIIAGATAYKDLSPAQKLIAQRQIETNSTASDALHLQTNGTNGLCMRTKYQSGRDATLKAASDFVDSFNIINPNNYGFAVFLYLGALVGGLVM